MRALAVSESLVTWLSSEERTVDLSESSLMEASQDYCYDLQSSKACYNLEFSMACDS